MTRDSNPSVPVNRYLNGFVRREMLETIGRFRPDDINNTFPFDVVSQRECDHNARTFTVITDYALHSRWIHPDTHKYYVAMKYSVKCFGFLLLLGLVIYIIHLLRTGDAERIIALIRQYHILSFVAVLLFQILLNVLGKSPL
ncbi:hypothetical protein AMS66_17425 [Paenibacillus xylanivorans]|uniref:Diacylglycerol glucosyltransferase N-terminal domain-containing protein n=2 Tax=Paenibacillus xylanivorans TaxID=1705561 RepID=A0A0M9BM76_9BACL|nr:hypothetical protein AMS66_17425 [Paenibacillus xylanivorans]